MTVTYNSYFNEKIDKTIKFIIDWFSEKTCLRIYHRIISDAYDNPSIDISLSFLIINEDGESTVCSPHCEMCFSYGDYSLEEHLNTAYTIIKSQITLVLNNIKVSYIMELNPKG